MTVPWSQLRKAAQAYVDLGFVVLPVDRNDVPIVPDSLLTLEGCLEWLDNAPGFGLVTGIAVVTGKRLITAQSSVQHDTWTLARPRFDGSATLLQCFRWQERCTALVSDACCRYQTVPPSPCFYPGQAEPVGFYQWVVGPATCALTELPERLLRKLIDAHTVELAANRVQALLWPTGASLGVLDSGTLALARALRIDLPALALLLNEGAELPESLALIRKYLTPIKLAHTVNRGKKTGLVEQLLRCRRFLRREARSEKDIKRWELVELLEQAAGIGDLFAVDAIDLPSELPGPLFTEFKAKYGALLSNEPALPKRRPRLGKNSTAEVVHALNFALLWQGPLYVHLTCAPEQSDRKTILQWDATTRVCQWSADFAFLLHLFK